MRRLAGICADARATKVSRVSSGHLLPDVCIRYGYGMHFVWIVLCTAGLIAQTECSPTLHYWLYGVGLAWLLDFYLLQVLYCLLLTYSTVLVV